MFEKVLHICITYDKILKEHMFYKAKEGAAYVNTGTDELTGKA
ncbi:hypothetical protein [Clostridium sp. MCC353]|nr:hypothetical protein [Clostridium sp. MCC353]